MLVKSSVQARLNADEQQTLAQLVQARGSTPSKIGTGEFAPNGGGAPGDPEFANRGLGQFSSGKLDLGFE